MNPCKDRSFLSSFSAKSRSPRTVAAFLTRLIQSPAERERTGLFFCEGLRFVARAADSPHFRPLFFVYAPDLFFRQAAARPILERLRARHPTLPLISLPTETLAGLSMAPDPQGIGAVVEQAWTPLYRLPPDAGLCYVAVDSVRNPGNLGTVLRTLEAVGGAGVICLPPEESDAPPVDPFAPTVVRASMASTFALRFARPAFDEWDRWRRKHGMLLIGTSPHTGEDYRKVVYGNRSILWIGDERKGLSEVQMARCDRLVRIPMAPTATADSLNMATATSVLLYQVFDQRNPLRE